MSTVYIQPTIEKKIGREYREIFEHLNLVNPPWTPLLYISQQDLFLQQRPQLSIKMRIVPITSFQRVGPLIIA